MQNLKINTLLLFFLAVLLSFSACKKDPDVDPPEVIENNDNKIRFLLNSSTNLDFNNKLIEFNNFNIDASEAGYQADGDYTHLRMIATWKDDVATMEVKFPGKEIGTIIFNEPEDIANPGYPTDDKFFRVYINQMPQQEFGGLAIKQVTIAVTEYGEIGEPIKGTFSAVVYEYTSLNEQVVAINNGTFELIRTN